MTTLNDRAMELMHLASLRPANERATFLDGACAGDSELRARIEALFQSDSIGEGATVADALPHVGKEPCATISQDARLPKERKMEQPGALIGRYKLLEPIGEGGFGSVWMAEQREPVKRRVALKIIKLGMDTKQVIARFEAERQALAMMDHPNIARVLDAGATDSGRPFFVMELVKGVTITEYCDTEKLNTTQRLELFIKVCNAVQHAHQKGIIHRDLKPSNVLVTLHDGVPVPKVIDFGIAKATNAELTEKTLFTEHRQMIGTPVYMSPEQAEMSGLDIDTRADIYSLGVLLYELLTGTTPFDAAKLKSAGYNEMLRILRDEEPQKPSTRLSTLQSAAHPSGGASWPTPGSATDITTIARYRRTDPGTLRKLLRGDLDWIVMRCLEKDRSRRYETANGLAMDVRRHIKNEPVVARPPSRGYRMRKFVQRNRVAVMGATVVSAVLVLGVIGTTWGWVRATIAEKEQTLERQRAEKARDDAETVTKYLSEMLSAADPAQLGKDATVRQVLDLASQTIGARFADQELLEARLRATVGNTYVTLGAYDAAEPHLSTALNIRRRLLSDSHVDTIRSTIELGFLHTRRRQAKEAEVLSLSALDQAQRFLGSEHEVTLLAIHLRSILLLDRGRYEEASSLMQRLLGLRRKVLGPEHPDTLKTMHNLAASYSNQGRYAEGIALTEQVLEIERRALGEEHPITLLSMQNLASMYNSSNRSAEGLAMIERVVEVDRRVLGDEHPQTLGAKVDLASLCLTFGRYAAARDLLNDVLEARRRILGPESVATLESMGGVAIANYWVGRLADAVVLGEQAVESLRRHAGEEAPETLFAKGQLANIFAEIDRHGRAAELLESVLETERRVSSLTPLGTLELLAAEYGKLGRTNDRRRISAEWLAAQCGPSERSAASARDLNNCAWTLLMTEAEDLREPERARNLAEQACALEEQAGGHALSIYLDTLALAQHRLGSSAAAVETQKRAVSLEPYVLSEMLDRLIEFEAALAVAEAHGGRMDSAQLRAAQKLEYLHRMAERTAATAKDLNNYAWALLTTEAVELRNPTQARSHAEAACALEDRNGGARLHLFLDTLALAQHMSGDSVQALRTQHRAISLAPADATGRPNMEKHLSMYEAALAEHASTIPPKP